MIPDENEKMILTLEITDPLVVEYLCRFPDELRPDKVLDALKVGVIAIQSASPSLDTEVVEQKFRQVETEIRDNVQLFKDELREKLEQYFRAEGGSVPLFMERYFGEEGQVSRTLDSYFNSEKGKLLSVLLEQVGPNSYIGKQMDPSNREGLISKIEKIVEEIIKGSSDQILSSFSLDDDRSSLSRLKRSIREEIEKLQKMTGEHYSEIREILGVEKGKAQEAVKGTSKGRLFEDALYEYLAGLAGNMEDIAENCSGAKGLVAYEKVGDYTVTLGETSRAPGKVIVFEAKKAGGYNMRKTFDELDRAKRNRGADIGIFVFSKGFEPVEGGDFYRIGNDFIVTVDEEKLMNGERLLFLEAAYKVARMLIVSRMREEEEKA
ncbi:MAG TPA: hypothetical protein PLV56_08005, partial [Synergistales bacterium]|nr:hypothetical protein [Synergistales bacterium]